MELQENAKRLLTTDNLFMDTSSITHDTMQADTMQADTMQADTMQADAFHRGSASVNLTGYTVLAAWVI